MDHRVPGGGIRASIVLILLSIATLLFLNNRFEGPADPLEPLSDATKLSATFVNTKKLPTKQPVLFKGLPIGRVSAVDWDRKERRARVSFEIDPEYELHADAVLRIGERSLIGDPYLDVVTRGSKRRPVLDDGDSVSDTRASVDFDEALDFLGPQGREDVRDLLRTVGRGVRARPAGEQINVTLGAAALTVEEAHALTQSLRGQEEQLGQLVDSAGTVLDELGARESAIRTIVSSGRTTLDALAANSGALQAGMVELPLALEAGRQTLDSVRPLVAELRDPVAEIRALTPDISRALEPGRGSLRNVAQDLDAVLADIPALRAAAVPALEEDIQPLVGKLLPLVKAIELPSRSLVPALEYLASGDPGTSRAEAIAGLYASIGAATKGTLSERGAYARAGFSIDLNEFTDSPADDCPTAGYCNNAYPESGDALDPQPFTGTYPRITECVVPPRSRPKRPCS